jgi:hypothetical protein
VISLRHLWFRVGTTDIVCAWGLGRADLAALVALLGLAALWAARHPRALWLTVFWAMTALGICGAENAFTLTSFWLLNGAATVLLFRWSTEGVRKGLHVFSLGIAAADLGLLLGYLFYSRTYWDAFLPTARQLARASVSLTTFPIKFYALSGAAALGARAAFGAGCLWLKGEPRLEAREMIALRLVGLLLPCGILFQKMGFAWAHVPRPFWAIAAAASLLAVTGAVLYAFGKEPLSLINPARWLEELVERPLRLFITFVDRQLEVRALDAVLQLPAKAGRAAGVWISLLQSGSLPSYLTLTALGLAGLLAWALWGAV